MGSKQCRARRGQGYELTEVGDRLMYSAWAQDKSLDNMLRNLC